MKFALGWLLGGTLIALYIIFVPLDRVASERNACFEQIKSLKENQND